MKINMYVLSEELDIDLFHSKTIQSVPLNISGFKLLDSDCFNTFYDDVLYIMDSKTILERANALKDKYILSIGTLSENIIKSLIKQNCMILVMDAGSLIECVNKVQMIFNKYSAWSERLLSACINNEAIEKVFDIALEMFPNPFYLMDETRVVLLTAGKIPNKIENTMWAYMLPHGRFDFDKYTQDNKKTDIENQLRTNEAMWYTKKERKYPFFFKSMKLNLEDNNLYGELGMIETYEPLTEAKFSLFAYVAENIENYMRSQNKVCDIHYSGCIFAQLLKGKFLDERLITDRLMKKGWVSQDEYYVLNFIKHENPESKIINYYISCLESIYPNTIKINFNDTIVVILRVADYEYLTPSTYSAHLNFFRESKFSCGVSQIFNDINKLYVYYRQSAAAAEYGIAIANFRMPNYFRQCYFQYLVSFLGSSKDREIACDPRVIRLKEFDIANNTEYIRTLYTFLLNGSSKTKTTEVLYLHRNTLANRLQSIENILGIDDIKNEEIDQLLISCMLLEDK